MDKFPLYSLCKRKISTIPEIAQLKELSHEMKKQLLVGIKALKIDQKGNLYCLIRCQSIADNDNTIYDSEIKSNGIIFDLDNFSVELQKIIYAYLEECKKNEIGDSPIKFQN